MIITILYLAGSKTVKGLYTSNKKPVIAYDGEFEDRIFSKRGNYLQQTMEKFSVKVCCLTTISIIYNILAKVD